MPQSDLYKYKEEIDYLADYVGADVARDVMKSVIEKVEDEVGVENVNGNQINPSTEGTLSSIDNKVATQATLEALAEALESNGTDLLRVGSPSPLDVSAAEVDVDINSQTLDTLTVTDNGSLAVASLPEPLDVSSAEVDVDLNSQTLSPITITDDGNLAIAAWNAGTLPTEQQTPVGIEDTGGTQIDPDPSPEYPEAENQKDLIANGDLVVGPVEVTKLQAVTIAANSVDGNTFSVSVVWQDSAGNTVESESAVDIGLENTTGDFARLVRKGHSVEVTFTDTSAGSANNVNTFVDGHK